MGAEQFRAMELSMSWLESFKKSPDSSLPALITLSIPSCSDKLAGMTFVITPYSLLISALISFNLDSLRATKMMARCCFASSLT